MSRGRKNDAKFEEEDGREGDEEPEEIMKNLGGWVGAESGGQVPIHSSDPTTRRVEASRPIARILDLSFSNSTMLRLARRQLIVVGRGGLEEKTRGRWEDRMNGELNWCKCARFCR